MRNLVAHKDKYLINFANSVYDEFRKLKYGIQSCRKAGNLLLDELRKDIAEYQSKDDQGALCEVSIRHMGWLPVYYPTTDTGFCNSSIYQTCTASPTKGIGMSYINQNFSTNLIEVNAGGCITRININPAINITNINNSDFQFIQNCADPQAVWYINHNLNLVPNVWAEDCNGDNISGVIDVVDNNTITLTFSSPVAGKAYLS